MEKFPQSKEYKKALEWSCELLALEVKEKHDYRNLKQALSKFLNRLITEDFNKLIAILYRIDISEEKARTALSVKKEHESAGEILADLIIARQVQKIQTRRKYS